MQPTQGGFVWSVYVGVFEGTVDSAAYEEAIAPARAAGYEVDGWADVNCDTGAAEALGVDPSGTVYVAGLYFATEADARAAAAAIGPDGVVGIAEVQTFCLD